MAEKDLHLTLDNIKELAQNSNIINISELDADLLSKILDVIKDTLLKKNEEYGNSFYNLRRDYKEYLPMRLTDKINRLRNLKQKNLDYTDTLVDIAGYVVLELYYLLFD